MSTYRNPWHNAANNTYGPAFYETEAKPVEYRGYLLYTRIPGPVGACVIDVVRDGVCVAQNAGPNGARRTVDGLVAARASIAGISAQRGY